MVKPMVKALSLRFFARFFPGFCGSVLIGKKTGENQELKETPIKITVTTSLAKSGKNIMLLNF